MTETLWLIVITTLLNAGCFLLGARIRQKVDKGEDIEIPKPIKTIQEFNANREVQKEIERDKVINENIDNYNGTPLGQQDIPR